MTASQPAKSLTVKFVPAQINVLPGPSRFPFDMHVTTVGMDRDDAFALRYKAYDAIGYAPEGSAGKFSDAGDDTSSSVVITAYDDGRPVGTVRVMVCQSTQPASALPCTAYYPVVNDLKRATAGAIVEVGRMAIDPEITNTSYRTTLCAALVRVAFIVARAAEAQQILVTSHPRWVPFYKAMLGFRAIGQPTIYPPGNTPITLLAGSILDAEKKQRTQNAFFKIADEEVESMRGAIGVGIGRQEANVATRRA
jgi:hypothetical protein